MDPRIYLPKLRGQCGSDKIDDSQVPPLVMQLWTELYKRFFEGVVQKLQCWPIYEPPDPETAKQINERIYAKQTVYLANLKRSLAKQIRSKIPTSFEDQQEVQKEGFSHIELELKKIVDTAPVESLYMNYRREIELELLSLRSEPVTKRSSAKNLVPPVDKESEFIEMANEITAYGLMITEVVEELKKCVLPLILEYDDKDKLEALDKVQEKLDANLEIHHQEEQRILKENQEELQNFEACTAEKLNKEYSQVLECLKDDTSKNMALATDMLLKRIEQESNFEIEWCKLEPVEKYQESMRLFAHECFHFLRTVEQESVSTEVTKKKQERRDKLLDDQIREMEEGRIINSLESMNDSHILIETTLADILFECDLTIKQLEENVRDISRKVEIWKTLVEELMALFQKYITYVMEESPIQSQYVLSVTELHEKMTEDYLKAERAMEEKQEAKMEEEYLRKRYPTCRPQRLSQNSSSDRDSLHASTTESSDGDLDNQIPDYLMVGIMTGVFPARPESYDELIYRRALEKEALLKAFGYEPTGSEELDTEPSEVDIAEPEPESIKECVEMDEPLKRKVNVVIDLMHSQPEKMKGYMVI